MEGGDFLKVTFWVRHPLKAMSPGKERECQEQASLQALCFGEKLKERGPRLTLAMRKQINNSTESSAKDSVSCTLKETSSNIKETSASTPLAAGPQHLDTGFPTV